MSWEVRKHSCPLQGRIYHTWTWVWLSFSIPTGWLWRPLGLPHSRLLGATRCDHPIPHMCSPRPACHLHSCVPLCWLDQQSDEVELSLPEPTPCSLSPRNSSPALLFAKELLAPLVSTGFLQQDDIFEIRLWTLGEFVRTESAPLGTHNRYFLVNYNYRCFSVAFIVKMQIQNKVKPFNTEINAITNYLNVFSL